MTAKRKRPKVIQRRYYATEGRSSWLVVHRDTDRLIADTDSKSSAKRIAAALNMYEATKRREI